MKNKTTLLNSVSSIVLQFFVAINGFVVPRLILETFGSELNGLVASLNQFLGYIALVEGGVSGVIMANLYKPLVEKDDRKISSVVVAAKKFYTQIGYIFIVYSIFISIVYPIYLKLDFIYVSSLALILSMILFIQYMFSLTLRTLLNADKKIYIVSFVQIVIIVLNMFLVWVSIRIYPNLHFVKLLSGLVYIIQPIVFSRYVKKHYNINWQEETDTSVIKQRWNSFAINIAAFVHGGTDVSVLTLFSSLKTVSIYSVYSVVTIGIRNIVASIAGSINPVIGHSYASGNIEDLNNKMDLFEYITLMTTGFLFTLTGVLITPFVMIYTSGISDANYYQPSFAYLLVISEAIYLLKAPHVGLAYSANKFKETEIPAFIESGLNIIISVVAVRRYGLIGVAVGSAVAMAYRTIFHINYTKKIIESRNIIKYYKKILIIILASMASVLLSYKLFNIEIASVFDWIIKAVEYGAITLIIYSLTSICFFRKETLKLIEYIKK